MDPITLNFHSDPGHGWLEVPAGLLPKSVINSISDCSYVKGSPFSDGILFLEEDCDANKALKHFKKEGIGVKINRISYDDDAPIRDYDRIWD